MKYFDWSIEKNDELKSSRDISFEEVVFHIMAEGLLDIVEHPSQEKYSNQRIFVVNIDRYVYLVPFVESETMIFLETIIPSRKMTRIFLGGKTSEN